MTLKLKLNSFTIFSFMLIFFGQAFAAEKFPYPELTVSPRATERLEKEYRTESRQKFFHNHLAIQASSLITFAAGLTHDEDDPGKETAMLGTVVGGGWLLATIGLDAFYRPYRRGLIQVKQAKGDSKRDQLAKERYAEEALYGAGGLGRKLDYLAAISNGITSMFMLSNVKGETLGEPIVVASAIASIAPLIFDNHWSQVEEKHKSYKKKIYGSFSLRPTIFKQDEHYAGGLRLALSF